jgi:hypothetical protein
MSNLETTSTYLALRRDLARKLRQVGILGTVRHIARRLLRDFQGSLDSSTETLDAFDLKYKTDTAGIVSVGALDIPDEKLEHSNRYDAVVPSQFFEMLDGLPIEPDEYVFIDIGSGKGRALLLASRLPFREIIGVEHSAALTEVAVKNIRIFKDPDQRCRKITVVCHDATAYEIPRGAIVLFMYNPFDEDLMQLLVANVEKSLRMLPRDIVVIYGRPFHRRVWDQSDAFIVIKSTGLYAIYRSV